MTKKRDREAVGRVHCRFALPRKPHIVHALVVVPRTARGVVDEGGKLGDGAAHGHEVCPALNVREPKRSCGAASLISSARSQWRTCAVAASGAAAGGGDGGDGGKWPGGAGGTVLSSQSMLARSGRVFDPTLAASPTQRVVYEA